MTLADDARAAAVDFEAKKNGLQQNQDGLWKISLTVADLPTSIMEAPMGTRYRIAAVEIGDDEEPVRPGKAGKGRQWHELSPSQQAGIRCADPEFQDWILSRTADKSWLEDTNRVMFTANYVRQYCGVNSRSELDTHAVAADKWRKLDQAFMARNMTEER